MHKDLKESSIKTMSVLIIDDEPTSLIIAAKLAKAHFQTVLTATDGQMGLVVYQQFFQENDQYPDLVICDIEMPNLNGYQLVSEIKHLFNDQFIMIISGLDEANALIPVIELGVNKFMIKPLDFSVFHKNVRKAIQSIECQKTSRAQAKLLSQNERRFSQAIEETGAGLWDWNMTTDKVFFSSGWKYMLGFEEYEIGNTLEEWEKRVKPDQLDSAYQAIKSHIEGKTPYYQHEHQLQCKNGRYKWILDQGVIVERNRDGKPTRMIGTHSDIDERKQHEQIQKEYLEIIDQNILSFSIDLFGNINSVSSAYQHAIKVGMSEMIGIHFNEMVSKSQPELILSGTKSNINDWIGELKISNGINHHIWVKAKAVPRIYSAPDQQGFTFICEDISDKKLLEKLSVTDPLTGMHNRRDFEKIFNKIINSTKRSQEFLSFVILDFDRFKYFNDLYGHQAGDQALIAVTQCIAQSFKRADDHCFRLGGEEFGILFRTSDMKQAIHQTEQLRRRIEALPIQHTQNQPYGKVTASFGLVSIDVNKTTDINKYYKAADQLLYQAKKQGRNRVCYNLFTDVKNKK